eukprot:Seg3025.6 transcript_id=Seg3025.6/GoldUCD/mRNA.D3Y31 product="hypothetical protein" protein_id=Seg3025.6/GoldUCD/D3Y31
MDKWLITKANKANILMDEAYVWSANGKGEYIRFALKGGTCLMELCKIMQSRAKFDDVDSRKCEKVTTRVRLATENIQKGLFDSKLLNIINFDDLDGSTLIFNESDSSYLSKDELFEKLHPMTKRTKYRGKVQEFLPLKTARTNAVEVGNFVIFEVGMSKGEESKTAHLYLDVRVWKNGKGTKSGIHIPENLLLQLAVEKQATMDFLKVSSERSTKLANETVEPTSEEVEAAEHTSEGVKTAETMDSPPSKKRALESTPKVVDPPPSRKRSRKHAFLVQCAHVGNRETEQARVVKAFVKVCHKHLLMKSRELCDGCGKGYADMLSRMKEASGSKENIITYLRSQMPEGSHRFDCLLMDPFKFATFHAAFIIGVMVIEGEETFLSKMREMYETVEEGDVKELFAMISGIMQAPKKVKLEAFLFDIMNVLTSELNPTLGLVN